MVILPTVWKGGATVDQGSGRLQDAYVSIHLAVLYVYTWAFFHVRYRLLYQKQQS